MKKLLLPLGFAALMISSCTNKPATELTLSCLNPSDFKTEVSSRPINLYTLKNKADMEVCMYKERLNSLRIRKGKD